MARITNQTTLQLMQVTPVGSGPMGVMRQSHDELIDYQVDYSGWLQAGDTVKTVKVTHEPHDVPDVIISNIGVVNNGTLVEFSVTAGIEGSQYYIVLEATLASGQIKRDEVFVIIGDGSTVYAEGGPQRFTRIAVGCEVDPAYIAKFYGNNILLQNRSSYNGGDGDMRLFLEKFTLLDEAATYYSNNGMPHARSGLIHDDHYSFEVSADGVTWIRAFEIDVATGDVTFANNINLPLPTTGRIGAIFAAASLPGFYVAGVKGDGHVEQLPFPKPGDATGGLVHEAPAEFNKYVSAITPDGYAQLTAFAPPTSTKLGMVFAAQAPVGEVCLGIDWNGNPIFGSADGAYLGVFPSHPTQGDINPLQWPLRPGSIYFNSTSNKPFIWTGSGWSVFWAPEKASTATLYYLSTAGQTAFPITTIDLFGSSYTFDTADPEAVEVYLNGVRLLPTYGTPPAGDYDINFTTNTVTFKEALPGNAVVTIDILTPKSKLAPGSVTIYPIYDLNIDPRTNTPGLVDGTRMVFTMYRTDGTTPVNASVSEEIFVSVDGVIQQPNVSFRAVGSTITFLSPPQKDSVIWAIWLKPGGAGSGGGVNPPISPFDTVELRYDWHPVTGGQWDDVRGEVHSVADTAARLALKDPENLIPGSLVFERDTRNLWVYTPRVAPPSTAGGSGAAAAGGTGATGTGSGAPVRRDVNMTAGDPNFKATILSLHNGDTVFYKGQYYQVTGVPSLGEESFPGGTSYAINPAPFIGQFSPVAGPSWNNYRAPTTPGMAQPTTGTTTGSTSSATPTAFTAAGDPTQTSNWMLLLPGHPVDNILRALEYDPSKPNSMAWEDNRDEMETVNAEADLYNPAVLPPSHLTVGKLVYVRATGQLWECIVDGTNGTITNTIADWKPLGGAGVTYVGRIGNLPDPTVKTVPDGSLFMVNMDLTGKEYHRLYVFDAQGVNAAGVVGVYRACSTKDFIKALRSDPDQGFDAEPGDLQVTLENGHKELKAVDATSAWQVVYSEDQVKSWIAASNLFQGTVEEPGHGTKGAIDLDKLPAETALGITDAGHYFVWVGTSGHIIGATEVGGAASAIAGARLSVGDWLVAANTGTAAAPVMKWTHIPGDLLSKGRGDGLYGLNNWVAGAYEQGSLVCFNGDIYKASQPVLATDIAPGATPTTPGATNPWAKVNISGGVKTVASDTNLPAGAANGAVYLVLSSAQAGGKGAMYMWDQASSHWQALGGGGIPLAFSGGRKIGNIGVPVGTVIDYAGKTLPAGYLLCNGATFDQLVYPELFKALGGNTLPDLRNQFVRGANTMAEVSFVKHDATTGMPKTHFTGVTNSTGSHTHVTDSQGEHRHNVGFSMSNHNWKGGGGWTGDATCNFSQDGGAASSSAGGHTHTAQSAGAHQHTVEIQSGGDPEGTAPMHVILAKIIKADDAHMVLL